MFKIGQRIRYIRKMRGYTQKQLGELMGFPSSNADVRIAQYEKGTRVPSEDSLLKLALVLNVSPFALNQNFTANPFYILHILIALDDRVKLRVTRKE
ncbi:helix-turn-helix domain-containing protein [Ruminococcus sp.]|uniref:helix-turn-helix domain-containing protein n=1 Tax=Ruminococcus sp. TaxID=41978 RepID=UPI00388F8950